MFSSKKSKDINLLPESEQVIKAARAKLTSTIVSVLIIILAIVISLAAFIFDFGEKRKADNLSNEIGSKTAEWQTFAKTAEDVGVIKSKIGVLKEASAGNETYKNTLVKIRSLVPDRLTLESLEVGSSGEISIQARTSYPAYAYQFIESIKNDQGSFGQVSLTSLTKDEGSYVLKLETSLSGGK